MSEEIKYEEVFGPQELFDGAPDDVDMIGHSGGHYKNTPNGILYCGGCTFTADELRNTGFIAMRRIIKTPVWTVADQKAGRLPEVGAKCRQGHKDEIVIAVTEKFVVTECQDMSVCTTRKDVFMRSYNPIETPEEKAARLREEWCSNALDSASILSGMREYELKRLGGYIGNIYDALLSGDLPVPVKE